MVAAAAGSRGILPFLAGVVALSAGCIQLVHHAGYDVMVEVRDGQTGQWLPEWVVESMLESNCGWTMHDAERTVETTTRLVIPQTPGESTYSVEAYTDGGVFLPGGGYGGWKSEWCRIYVVGYEMGIRLEESGVRQVSPGSGQTRPVHYVRYALFPWDNAKSNPAVADVLGMVQDQRSFIPYEALRGTPQGAGVPGLYRYYIERYKAILDAEPDVSVAPGATETVAWLEKILEGNAPPAPGLSPTTVRREPGGTVYRQVFRVIPKDAQTGQTPDSWVTEVDLAAQSAASPRPERRAVLTVASGTAAWPETRVPPYVDTERHDGVVTYFVDYPVVYATGYDPWDWINARRAREGGRRRAGLVECRLQRWDNNNAQAMKDFALLLEDDERFSQYERVRRQGALGVLDLYRYFLSRCDALDSAGRLTLSDKARQRVAWVRGQVATQPGGHER
jgi:hypothetical protein